MLHPLFCFLKVSLSLTFLGFNHFCCCLQRTEGSQDAQAVTTESENRQPDTIQAQEENSLLPELGTEANHEEINATNSLSKENRESSVKNEGVVVTDQSEQDKSEVVTVKSNGKGIGEVWCERCRQAWYCSVKCKQVVTLCILLCNKIRLISKQPAVCTGRCSSWLTMWCPCASLIM